MDPLQSEEISGSENSQNSVIVTNTVGEVRIQLEGSHTSSTETECVFSENKNNVKFQDANKKQNLKKKPNSESKERTKLKEEHKQPFEKEENLSVVRVTKDFYMEEKRTPQLTPVGLTTRVAQTKNLVGEGDLKAFSEDVCSDQQKMQNISSERNEISQRLEQIIDMFDSLNKSLETLDLKAKPKTLKETAMDRTNRKILKTEWIKEQQSEPEEHQKQRSRFEEYSIKEQTKTDNLDSQDTTNLAGTSSVLNTTISSAAELEYIEDYLKQQKMALNDLENEAKTLKATQARSISTATSSCELKSFGCQTKFSDHISLNTLDLLEVSSLASRSEQPNSLNNFAQAENACVPYRGSQQDLTKQPLIQQPLTSATVIVQQAPIVPQFSVINIEANARPSSIDLRRPPFWQRLWEVIGEFCAATFLCLQVNKDFIFCLGFVVAFVVSASFLTAFFYNTIILSPTLWLTEDSPRF